MPKRRDRPADGAARRALLDWYHRKARRLPWRGARSSYAVWVSEVMLQQTQVAAVIPHYRRFLRAFPTARTLAEAPLEKVLELWAGLGYYRRARNLHAAARILVRKFNGRFPRDYHEARSLTGVGDYTARAVLSIAYNQPYTVLDGNVARVVARLRAVRGNLHEPRFRRVVERDLESLLAPAEPGNFNQALMELGQTVCLPRAPRCPICPLRKGCRAFHRRRPESFPAPRPRRATEVRYLAAGLLRRGNQVALMRGLDEGLLDDLWNFPAAFGGSPAEALGRLQDKLRGMFDAVVRCGTHVGGLRHGITFREIHVNVYAAKPPRRFRTSAVRWFPLSRLSVAAVSQLSRKIAAQL
ncbi:MAG: A/G-specific adenine glycosylase [Acidobacteria bacterium]|nr:A/G-specific adenine glycosylase [Acidobacteriota bacterium]